MPLLLWVLLMLLLRFGSAFALTSTSLGCAYLIGLTEQACLQPSPFPQIYFYYFEGVSKRYYSEGEPL